MKTKQEQIHWVLKTTREALETIQKRVKLGDIAPLQVAADLKHQIKQIKLAEELNDDRRKPLRSWTPLDEAWSFDLDVDNSITAAIDEGEEKAWVTFIADNVKFEIEWFPVTIQINWEGSDEDLHLTFDYSETMEICRERWGGEYSFGIAPTSQMLRGNVVQSNF